MNTDFWFPPSAGAETAVVDELFAWILAVCGFFGALVTALLVLFAWRYRARSRAQVGNGPTDSHLLEAVWTLVPAVLVAVMFYRGADAYVELRTPPDEAYEVLVRAQKWSWTFTYPNGHVSPDLHVPVGRPIALTMTSEDAIHSFFARAFRVKMDVVPGRYTTAWFTPTEPGTYEVQCTEYCGTGHSNMNAALVVHPQGEFERWLERASNQLDELSPVEGGELLYRQRGCFQCHSVDGARNTGPSFQGLYGSERILANGDRVLADEDYVRESILEPQAKLVAGWPPVMPTYKGRLQDREITALIAYLKSLSP